MNVSKSPNNLGTFYTNLGTSVNNHLNTIAKTTNDTVNSVTNSLRNIAKNTPLVNSIAPAAASVVNSTGSMLSNTFGSIAPAAANVVNTTGSMFNNTKNMLSNTGNTLMGNVKPTATNMWLWPTIIFIIISVVCITLLVVYKDKISTSLSNISQKIRSFFNKPVKPIVNAAAIPVANVNAPVSPQQDQLNETVKSSDILNKLIPSGKNEVFNVSKNDFPYEDAEPLCNALGAELATYDQVKEAWAKGADWCNYGWVKGQAAVYPIQQETWNKIQSGPEENRNSCGAIGVNGGYFENPDMKFGVNCYGVKPVQSAHDEEVLMKNGEIPQTVPALEVDKKIQEFKKESDRLGLLPFNHQKWSN